MTEIALIRSKANGVVHEVPVGSVTYKRCKAHPNEYEDVTKPKQVDLAKKPEKSG